MSALAEKIRKAREFRVEIAGFSFTLRRPTDVEWYEMAATTTKARAVFNFIVGWDGVKEIDLIPGGDAHPAAFDRDACEEWLTDRPDILPELIEAFLGAFQKHLEARETAAKK